MTPAPLASSPDNSQDHKRVKANPFQMYLFLPAIIMIPWPPSVTGVKVNHWTFNDEKQKEARGKGTEEQESIFAEENDDMSETPLT